MYNIYGDAVTITWFSCLLALPQTLYYFKSPPIQLPKSSPQILVIPKLVPLFPCLHLIFRSVLQHLFCWPSDILRSSGKTLILQLSVIRPDLLEYCLSTKRTDAFASYFLFHSLQHPYLWSPCYCSLSLSVYPECYYKGYFHGSLFW